MSLTKTFTFNKDGEEEENDFNLYSEPIKVLHPGYWLACFFGNILHYI